MFFPALGPGEALLTELRKRIGCEREQSELQAMKRVCLWGTSLKKIADEAQLLAVIKIIHERVPGAHVSLFSTGQLRMDALSQRYGFRTRTMRTARLWNVIPALAASDLFVMVGGPFFEEIKQTIVCLGLFVTAKLLRVPVVTYCVTAFPFQTWWGRSIYRWIFNRMDAISVRDQVVVPVLRELGVKKKIDVCADPRYVLDCAPQTDVIAILEQEGIRVDEPFVVVTTRLLHHDVPEWVKRSHGYTKERVVRTNEALAHAIGAISEVAQVVILPMHPTYEEDLAVANAIRRSLKDPSRLRILSRRYDAVEVMGLIERSEFLLACRLGSAVFASAMGTPIVGVAYDPRLLDHMKQIGFPQDVLDWKDIHSGNLTNKIREIWNGRSTYRARMNAQRETFRAMAYTDADLITKFL